MQRVLFHSTIFGPIHSRRLGSSLGINLTPSDGKVCSFDCLYCEAGFNAQGAGKAGLPPRVEVARLLEEKLADLKAKGEPLDVITFSGNGEPTLHPDFEGIIDDTIALRDRWFPDVKISVLSNATMIHKESVCRALERVDNNILKLDSAIDSTVRLLDRPTSPAYTVADTVARLKRFGGNAIIQTMLTSGTHDGKTVDNTTDAEITALIDAYKAIKPREVMLYTIDRPTPETTLRHTAPEVLRHAAGRIEAEAGVPVQLTL